MKKRTAFQALFNDFCKYLSPTMVAEEVRPNVFKITFTDTGIENTAIAGPLSIARKEFWVYRSEENNVLCWIKKFHTRESTKKEWMGSGYISDDGFHTALTIAPVIRKLTPKQKKILDLARKLYAEDSIEFLAKKLIGSHNANKRPKSASNRLVR